MERTFFLIKPDAVNAGVQYKILQRFQDEGFIVIALKLAMPTMGQWMRFYADHKDRGFFMPLLDFVSSGPVYLGVMQRGDAIRKAREICGATNPARAGEGTLRKLFGTSIDRNAIYTSDAPESAAKEVAFWFSEAELG